MNEVEALRPTFRDHQEVLHSCIAICESVLATHAKSTVGLKRLGSQGYIDDGHKCKKPTYTTRTAAWKVGQACRLCHTFGHTLADSVRPSPRSTCMPFQNVSEFFGRPCLSIASSAPAARPQSLACTQHRKATRQPAKTATCITDTSIKLESAIYRLPMHACEINAAAQSSQTPQSTSTW